MDLEWWVWLPSLSGHFVSFCCTIHYIVMCGWRSQGVHFGCGSSSSLLLGHLWLQLGCKLETFVCSTGYTVTPFMQWLLHSTVVLVTCCYFWCVYHSWFIYFLCSLVVAILFVGVAPTNKVLGPVQEWRFYVECFLRGNRLAQHHIAWTWTFL